MPLLQTVFGPPMAAVIGDELTELLAQESWVRPVYGQVVAEAGSIDRAWALWCHAASDELAALTGSEYRDVAAAYQYEDFCPLRRAREAAAAAKKRAGSNSFLQWLDRRLCEAASANRNGVWQHWCGRHWLRARDGLRHSLHLAASAISMLKEPWLHSADEIGAFRDAVKTEADVKEKQAKEAALREWKDKVNRSAEIGSREAFRILRADDNEREHTGLCVSDVIKQHTRLWGGLWRALPEAPPDADELQYADDLRAMLDGRTVRIFGPEEVQDVCSSFPSSTSCPDGLPCRLVGRLSVGLRRALGQLFAVMLGCGLWPTTELEVQVVLIPKATGGERPVALFRSATRIAAKLYGRLAAEWLRRRAPPWNNVCAGRRAGDGAWRSQLRAATWAGGGGVCAEVALDLAKAFETVYRPLLLREARLLDYPVDALAMASGMYALPRRLVYRQCVSQQLWPARGIAAGSATATTELTLLMSRVMDQVAAQDRSVLWAVHVDDVSATTHALTRQGCVQKVEVAFSSVVEGLRARQLVIADGKTTVTCTSTEVAGDLKDFFGDRAEIGTVVKKLGIDYTLASAAAVLTVAPCTGSSRSARSRRRCGKASRGRGALAGSTSNCARGPGVQRRRLKGKKGVKWVAPVRQMRLAKALRRADRLRLLDVRFRAKLFHAGVLPAAGYGSEHMPWEETEMKALLRTAVHACGLQVPGVPFSLLKACLPLGSDPQWRYAWAAVERWAREVWLISRRSLGNVVQADVLSDDAWAGVFRLWQEAVTSGDLLQLPPPLLALHQALDVLQLEWCGPFTLRGKDGQPFLCDLGSPAMLRKLFSHRYREINRAFILRSLLGRWSVLRRTGGLQLQELCQPVDVEGLCGLLLSMSCKPGIKRPMLALAWGV